MKNIRSWVNRGSLRLEKYKRAKIDKEIVQQIYRKWIDANKAGMPKAEISRAIAAEYGITYSTVVSLLTRRSWGREPVPEDWINYNEAL